ncbi:MAG TPA: hypothetical protein VFA67_13070 [Candidatus Sulfotelmatobacter sp.]|nr:hypothetical protein [Candidatus Sulfotelmatobacter sp.]
MCPAPRTLHRMMAALAVTSLLWTAPGAASPAGDKKNNPAVRWDERAPGCTFSRSPDGKLRYGLWSGDLGITLAVDEQELEKVRRRHEPFFAVLLELRDRGQQSLDLNAHNISLEFVKHFQVEQTALDPDEFTRKIQGDADALNRQTAREVKKDPVKNAEKEAYLRAYLKDSAELQEFVGKDSLRAAHLDAGNPQVSGWVLFSTKNKWIGGWKTPEEFILRVPMNGKVFEFPFTLPPKGGEKLLRRR